MKSEKADTIITKELECKLTSEEIRSLGVALANAIGELESLEQEKIDFMADLKSRQKDARAQVKLLAAKIRTGSEVRLVECRIEKDSLANTIRTFRLDTGELVEERPMTPEERQMMLMPETGPTGPRQIELG